jgi:uncharacterized membrane protein
MYSADPSKTHRTAVAALIAVAFLLASSNVTLKTVAAVPLVMYLPGSSVIRAARMDWHHDLRGIALAVGLSMAIAVLGGLVIELLNALSLNGWAVLLGSVVLLASVVSSVRSRQPTMPVTPNAKKLTSVQWTMYGTAALVMLASVGLARVGAVNHHEYAFTEFWMVPKGAVGGNIITVGVSNSEKAKTTYDVVLFADDATVARMPSVTLLPGESWSEDVFLNGQLARAARVQAWLFRSDAPHDVYRKVWLSNSVSSNTVTAKDQR